MNQGIFPGETDVPVSPTDAGMLVVDISGTFVVPVPDFEIEMVGGGCGGATANFGGPSAGYVFKRFTGVTVGTVATIIIGSSGAGGVALGAGSNGSASIFSVPGYTSLIANSGNTTGNLGGTASGGDINMSGQGGTVAIPTTGSGSNGGQGGNTLLGLGGQGYLPSGDGRPATGAGAGGAGGTTDGVTPKNGGAGSPGRAIIRWSKT